MEGEDLSKQWISGSEGRWWWELFLEKEETEGKGKASPEAKVYF